MSVNGITRNKEEKKNINLLFIFILSLLKVVCVYIMSYLFYKWVVYMCVCVKRGGFLKRAVKGQVGRQSIGVLGKELFHRGLGHIGHTRIKGQQVIHTGNVVQDQIGDFFAGLLDRGLDNLEQQKRMSQWAQ
jgi:hypothetical protein